MLTGDFLISSSMREAVIITSSRVKLLIFLVVSGLVCAISCAARKVGSNNKNAVMHFDTKPSVGINLLLSDRHVQEYISKYKKTFLSFSFGKLFISLKLRFSGPTCGCFYALGIPLTRTTNSNKKTAS